MSYRSDEVGVNACEARYDLYGNKLESPNKSSDEADVGTYYAKKGDNSKDKRKQAEKRNAKAMEEGNCLSCYKPGHYFRDCEERKKKLEKVKALKLSQGIPWKNGDGTVTMPNGRTIPAAEAEKDQTSANRNKPNSSTANNVGITFAAEGWWNISCRGFV